MSSAMFLSLFLLTYGVYMFNIDYITNINVGYITSFSVYFY